MRLLQLPDVIRFRTMTTNELRESFLLDDLFEPGHINLVYIDLDRTVVGSIVPNHGPLQLPTQAILKASYFLERREMGILNIGGPGTVTVDGEPFHLTNLEALYIGRGKENILFESAEPEQPAEFYLVSYPAHSSYPVHHVHSSTMRVERIGSPKTANERAITKLIYPDAVQSCQLVMGFTQLAPGSVWNTMPPHTHMRRSEVYLYFNISAEERIVHLMGPPQETRNLVVANKQAVVSPGWSIHAGVGTANYAFCWGMGGENQEYNDMDRLPIADLL